MVEIRFPIWITGELENNILSWLKEYGLNTNHLGTVIEFPDQTLASIFVLTFGVFPLNDPREQRW